MELPHIHTRLQWYTAESSQEVSQGFEAPQELYVHPFKDRESSNDRGSESFSIY